MAKTIIEIRRIGRTTPYDARIIQRGNRRINRIKSEQNDWHCFGDTPTHALGGLVSNHPKLFDIKLVKNY